MQLGKISESIGLTPMIKLDSLSKRTGQHIYGKAEFLNPGGSIKDRTALGIILAAEVQGQLRRGFSVIEGTAGNTGIGLAMLARERGYSCTIVMPNNQAPEKYVILKALGVELITVPPCPFANENHFYHTARKISEERKDSFWANQFENPANADIHYQTTGREIWEQLQGKIDAFLCSSGTGGTIAGVSRYLKEKNPQVHVRLVDPQGSGLYSYLTTGEIKSSGSSITEGIGIMRLTANFKTARIDDAVQVNDQEMLDMLYHLAKHDGLLVGMSAALNVFAAYKYALAQTKKGLNIVTVLPDSALRYQNKVFNQEFLQANKLIPNSL